MERCRDVERVIGESEVVPFGDDFRGHVEDEDGGVRGPQMED